MGVPLIRFDMSEFGSKHEVAKLVGAPPGYVGFDEGGQLTERVRRKPFSVVLFDEIEKAHPDIFNSLLQILEEGRLTDGQGRVVDFKNTIIIMTSNLGARFLDKRSPMGFSAPSTGVPAKVEDQVMSEVKKAFNPEFLNRLDETILFTSLTDEDLLKIMHLLAEQINQNLVVQANLSYGGVKSSGLGKEASLEAMLGQLTTGRPRSSASRAAVGSRSAATRPMSRSARWCSPRAGRCTRRATPARTSWSCWSTRHIRCRRPGR